jgi:hypothetical protein
MISRLAAAEYVAGYTVWLRFDDGLEGEIDLSEELHGPVFGPLRDVRFFRQVQLHPELKTLVWPNGADFAPEFLRKKLSVAIQ